MSKKSPQLRFEGFTDDWEERKLKDVVEKQIKGKAQFEKLEPGSVEYLDTSRLNGGQAILTNGLKDVTLDDVLILWDGSKAGTVYHGFEGSLGSTLKAYRTSADSKFVYQYLKRYQDNIYNNYRTPNIPHVQKDFLDVFTISVPRSDEQAKIGSFFKQLDDTIALHQRKLDLLKEQKKGFLQKMFPKNGAKVPELRFAGFVDDWEQRKLIDYLEVSKEKNKNEVFGKEDVLSVSGDYGIVNQIEFQGRSFAGASVAPYGIVNTGYIVYTKSPLKSNPYGIIKVNKGKTGIVSTLYAVYKPLDNVCSNFVQIYFEQNARMNNYMHPLVNKGAKNDMKVSDVNALKGEVCFPSKDEQIKISEHFENLDRLITLHQRKLDLLKEQKKGFLQKMFV